ncbi:Gfo/Idh/MocA family protein [Xanthovirga aplysinae]|uniref:Gfo/Idh/MocA family protein n=1 Tax=Xanthovirga aplysinae TaxID=2529853 RepID=UPI0012BD579D|nr:Gfo/Idh/MocA family oxidoreductase [Xanthovirga aplysinae]MTI32253.1 Gfo/Idh/MocA family oxidoreductase [Xanthovirga aplysinae]
MTHIVRWGILSTARIGTQKVVPAMQGGEYCQIEGIASRSLQKAEEEAKELGLPRAFGSYEELLNDPKIDAIYNPLPNHLHLPWTIKALEAGKHVLCEKPIGLNAEEAKELKEAASKFPGLKVMEAFMYRFHPTWKKVQALVRENEIGEVKTIQSFFSYYNIDPENIRNKPEMGGGGLMDIGCYCISVPRFLFEAEPKRVMGLMDLDPEMKVDRLASGILDFSNGRSATFTCSTQVMPYQKVNVLGTDGRIEVEIPFNIPHDVPTKIWLHSKEQTEELRFDPANQYTLQGDIFSRTILQDSKVPTPLDDAIGNMKVIDGIKESSERSEWVNIG